MKRNTWEAKALAKAGEVGAVPEVTKLPSKKRGRPILLGHVFEEVRHSYEVQRITSRLKHHS